MYDKCPACSHLLRQKYFDQTVTRLCTTGCGGIWLIAKDLEALIQKPRIVERMLAATNFDFKQHPPQLKNCPDCSCRLKALLLKGDAKVEIDTCPECHGIWLDKGEIKALTDLYHRARIQHLSARFEHTQAGPVNSHDSKTRPQSDTSLYTTIDILNTACYGTEVTIHTVALAGQSAATIAEYTAVTAGSLADGAVVVAEVVAESTSSGADAIGNIIEILLGLSS